MTPFFHIPIDSLFYPIFCLLPAAIVSALDLTLHSLGRLKGKEEILHTPYVRFFKKIQPGQIWEATLFSLRLTKFIYYLIFGFTSFYFIFLGETPLARSISFYTSSVIEIGLIVFISLFLEILLSFLVDRHQSLIIRYLSIPAFLLMLPCMPWIALYFFLKSPSSTPQKLSFRLQDKLLEYLSESDLKDHLNATEKKWIHTAISFKDRIVREVMVPRVNICSLPSDTPIQHAVKIFSQEGYSRIPVYKDTIDKIIGVLLYKDLLPISAKNFEGSLATIESLVKPVLYTPETKKISHLLQEFRNKKIHLAIVVDEYGGTEGIVTIEDILEELVGNIEDEYDTQEDREFTTLSSGGWIVDAKMSILDLEEELGVHIPTNSEYDTLGGYIFHRVGMIPSKGWKIHLEKVDLEILHSDERSIQKVKITPHKIK